MIADLLASLRPAQWTKNLDCTRHPGWTRRYPCHAPVPPAPSSNCCPEADRCLRVLSREESLQEESHGAIAELGGENLHRPIRVKILMGLAEESDELLRSQPIADRLHDLREPGEDSSLTRCGVPAIAFPPGDTHPAHIEPLGKLLLAEAEALP